LTATRSLGNLLNKSGPNRYALVAFYQQHHYIPSFLPTLSFTSSSRSTPLSAAMSAHSAHPAESPYRPYLQSTASSQDDFKASYDDLIDEYSSPYTANAQHQTFAVGAPTQNHKKVHSIPLSNDSAFASKQSDDTHDTAYNYPPAVPAKDIDTRSVWQKAISPWFFQLLLLNELHRFCPSH
jgi:hypothetical protein